MFRRICIVLVLSAFAPWLIVFLAYGLKAPSVPILPFPTAGMVVKGRLKVAREGEFAVSVLMAGGGFPKGPVPCTLIVTIGKGGQNIAKKEIPTLHGGGTSAAGVGLYSGDGFRLARGDYDLAFTSRETCAAAAARGATLTLYERSAVGSDDAYFHGLIMVLFSLAALCSGLLGLIACEFRGSGKSATPAAATPP